VYQRFATSFIVDPKLKKSFATHYGKTSINKANIISPIRIERDFIDFTNNTTIAEFF